MQWSRCSGTAETPVVRVENIYYLLCYAWDHADLTREAAAGDVAAERSTLVDLLGHVLATRAAELLRRGLHREYVTQHEEPRSPRGKIDVSTQVKRSLRPAGRVACVVDELDYDVLLNRLVRTTLVRTASAVAQGELRERLGALATRMHGVGSVEPTPAHFARLRLHRLNSHYGFVIDLCELLTNSLLPTRAGGWSFVDFTGDERTMGRLFEDFVRNFFACEQNTFRVGRNRIEWPVRAITAGSESLLPSMETDITLQASGCRHIVETKFYSSPLREGRSGGQRKLREAHLYQVFAYMQHFEAIGRPVQTAVLLYAAAGERFDHQYQIGKHVLRACTLDLDQPWQLVSRDLLALVDWLGRPQAQVAQPLPVRLSS